METKSDILNLAVVNFKVNYGDKEYNLRKIKDFTIAAAKRGADLILFPELCLTGYDFFVDETVDMQAKMAAAETLCGNACNVMSEVAKQYGVHVIFGMGEKLSEDADVIYNSAVAINAEGVIGSYRKIHPFDNENCYFAKGDQPFMFDSPWGPIGMAICYDTYQFPELMRYYAAKGARLYLNPTALVEDVTKDGSRKAFKDYYVPTLEYGVLCNTIFIASANLTGWDKMNYFAGGSMIIGPAITPFFETNKTCYAGDANEANEGIFLATIDLSLATRRLFTDNQYTNTPDFRPEIYAKLCIDK